LNTVTVEVKQSYYLRMLIVNLLAIIPGIIIAKHGIPDKTAFIIVGLLFIFITPSIFYYQRRQWVTTIDDLGITRQDGRKFIWLDLVKINHIYVHSKSGSKYLNHIELNFKTGKALIFPLMLSNGVAIISMVEKLAAEQPKQLNDYQTNYF
jgi:hypothetical protein